jgi:hypothetical protein
MMKKLTGALFFLMVFSVFSAAKSLAADSYQLSIKGEKGEIKKFSADVAGTLNLNLDGLPVPNSKISGENIAAKISLDTYFDTLEASGGGTKFLIKLMMKNLTLGGLLQIPDLGGIGKGKAPEIELDISPQGGIDGVQVHNLNLSAGGGEGGGMKNMIPGLDSLGGMDSLDTILPMITGMIPPIFPKDPVAVGDTWVQKVSDENNPMPIFPKIVVNYKLVSVENDKAHIEFTTDGDYNADFLNNFLSMIPEIPMGTDNMTINNVDLKMKWKMDGTMDFLIGPGVIDNMDIGGNIKIKGGAKITFKHPDETTTLWEPKLDGSVDLNAGLKYEGAVTRDVLDSVFPPEQQPEKTVAPSKETKKTAPAPAKKGAKASKGAPKKK